MYLRNKISYIVKMERQGGLIINMGYTTVRYMTQKVSLLLDIVIHLLCELWCKINDTVWAKECDIKLKTKKNFGADRLADSAGWVLKIKQNWKKLPIFG